MTRKLLCGSLGIKMDDKYKINLLLETIKRIDAYIISTNTKASLIIVLNSFLLGIIFINHDKIINLYAEEFIKAIVKLALPLIGLFCTISIGYLLSVIYPWLQSSPKNTKEHKLSLFFFGDISLTNEEEFSNTFRSITFNEIFLDLTNQVSVLSRGLMIKMQKTKLGINCLIIGLVIIVILFLLFFTQFIEI